MKKLFWLFVLVVLSACDTSAPLVKYQVKIPETKRLNYGDTIHIEVSRNEKKVNVDAVSLNGKRLAVAKGGFVLEGVKLGEQVLHIDVSFNQEKATVEHKITIYADKAPKIWGYKIINEYPRNKDHYTQGLEFYRDTLYESIGLYGKSKLMKVDYKTGKIYREYPLTPNYFGEGMTILNDRIYQLTWREGKAFIYDLSFHREKEFAYSGEGWGICNDGKRLYMSDGSSLIRYVDPEDFSRKEFIQLCSDKSIYERANELEWAEGKIYANTYLKDGIMIIDPKSGAIEGIIDMRGLKERVSQIPSLDVLNGIAYHPQRKTFWVTGKNWDKLFEVSFYEK